MPAVLPRKSLDPPLETQPHPTQPISYTARGRDLDSSTSIAWCTGKNKRWKTMPWRRRSLLHEGVFCGIR